MKLSAVVVTEEEVKAFEKIAEWAREEYKEQDLDGMAVILNGLHTLIRHRGFDPADLDLHNFASWIEYNLPPQSRRLRAEGLVMLTEAALQTMLPTILDIIPETLARRSRGSFSTATSCRNEAGALRSYEMPKAVNQIYSRYMIGAVLLGTDNPVVIEWRKAIADTQKLFEDKALMWEKMADDTDRAELEDRLLAFTPWDRSTVKRPTATEMGCRKGGKPLWLIIPRESGGSVYSDRMMLDFNKPRYPIEKVLDENPIRGNAESYIVIDADVELTPRWHWVCSGDDRVVCSNENGFVVILERYLNHFLTSYPDAVFYAHQPVDGHWYRRPLRVASKGETVGVLMPVVGIGDDDIELFRDLRLRSSKGYDVR